MAKLTVTVILHDSRGQLVDETIINLTGDQAHILHSMPKSIREGLFNQLVKDIDEKTTQQCNAYIEEINLGINPA